MKIPKWFIQIIIVFELIFLSYGCRDEKLQNDKINTTVVQEPPQKVIYYSKIDSLYKNSTTIYREFEKENISNEVNSIFYLDVFGYFGLYNTYSTPLKRKIYQQSAEYKVLYDSLKIIKRNIHHKWYNVQSSVIADNHHYDVNVNKYTLIALDHFNHYLCEQQGNIEIHGVYFPELNNYAHLGKSIIDIPLLILQIPCSESTAVKLEEIKNLKVVFLFRASGVEQFHFKGTFDDEIDQETPVAKDTHILLMDDYGNCIYSTKL